MEPNTLQDYISLGIERALTFPILPRHERKARNLGEEIGRSLWKIHELKAELETASPAERLEIEAALDFSEKLLATQEYHLQLCCLLDMETTELPGDETSPTLSTQERARRDGLRDAGAHHKAPIKKRRRTFTRPPLPRPYKRFLSGPIGFPYPTPAEIAARWRDFGVEDHEALYRELDSIPTERERLPGPVRRPSETPTVTSEATESSAVTVTDSDATTSAASPPVRSRSRRRLPRPPPGATLAVEGARQRVLAEREARRQARVGTREASKAESVDVHASVSESVPSTSSR